MVSIRGWVARIYAAIIAPKVEAKQVAPAAVPTLTPPLTIYPYYKPVGWDEYLVAWNNIMGTDNGRQIAGMISQNYARELMSQTPAGCDTFEKRVVWQAGHDAKLEVWQSMLTAATLNTQLRTAPKRDVNAVPAPN